VSNFEEVVSCCAKFLFHAASLMNNMETLATMPVSIPSPLCPEAAASRGRKD